MQDWHYAGVDSQRGIDRHRLPLGHVDVRGCPSAYAAWNWAVDRDRDWWRSDYWHQFYRCPGPVQPRSGDGSGDYDRRNWRQRRGDRCGVCEDPHEEAGGRLYRRTDRASGTTHGARGSDHFWWQRDRSGKDESAGSLRDSRGEIPSRDWRDAGGRAGDASPSLICDILIYDITRGASF